MNFETMYFKHSYRYLRFRMLCFFSDGSVCFCKSIQCKSLYIYTKDLKKIALDTSLFNTQHYKVRIKGKVKQFRERVASSSTLQYSSYWKGSLLVALDYSRQLYLLLKIKTNIKKRVPKNGFLKTKHISTL